MAVDRARRLASVAPAILSVGAILTLILVLALARAERRALAVDLGTQRDLHGQSYAGSLACRRCHEDHYRSWHRTFHRTMTQAVSAANPGAVLGDFSGVTYRHDGVDARMDRDATGAFRMTFTRADRQAGSPPAISTAISTKISMTISRTIGSRRYQQYLTRIGDAEYRLPIAFHVEERRWFHMNGAFPFAESDVSDPPADAPPPSPAPAGTLAAFVDGLARLGGAQYPRHVTRWNDNCVFCHNVAPNPGRDPVSGRFQTEVAEMGIACEACHGPGAAHARANGDPVRRYALHLQGRPDPTIVNPSRLSPARAADLCGRCHGQRITDDVGRFLDHGDPFVPGDDLALWSSPLWQDTPLGTERAPFAPRFWADGTARLTAYEYQGLLQSPCTQRGTLTCVSCHGMHDGDPRGQLRPSAAGNGACTGCHGALASADAQVRHSHHGSGGAAGVAGARAAAAGVTCVDCHMPRIVYGILDIHRSHRIEVPDPARAAAYGRPDACTACHADQTPAWAATAVQRLWGHGTAGAGAGPTATGGAGIESEGPLARVLSGDPIERAVAADELGQRRVPLSSGALAIRAGLLLEVMAGDDYPAVRHLAWRALGRLRPPSSSSSSSSSSSLGLAAYDPNGGQAERQRAVEQLRRALPPPAVVAPAPASVRRLRAAASAVAIEIGE